MGVGDSLELPYTLPGALPAGTYRLRANGFQTTGDGVLLGEVFYQSQSGGAPVAIASATGTPPGPNMGLVSYLDVSTQAAAAATCGDTLLYRVTVVSGTADFFEVFLILDIP